MKPSLAADRAPERPVILWPRATRVQERPTPRRQTQAEASATPRNANATGQAVSIEDPQGSLERDFGFAVRLTQAHPRYCRDRE